LLSSILFKSIFKDLAILLLRVFTGALLIHHGFEKLNDINNFADAFVRPLHLPFPVTLSYIAAFSEIVGSWSLIIGLGTRLGASAILGTMSVAIYHALVTSGFNIYLLELLALYFSSAISIILLGPGKFSADYLVNEIFINKLNPIKPEFNQETIDSASPKKTKNSSKKSKQDKNFAFPFSSFLSS
jgi:putative oxidoreductase